MERLLFLGGKFDCCYKTNVSQSPILASNFAVIRGAGFYHRNKTEDESMKQICCFEANSNYFCSLFASIRTATSSSSYLRPIISKINKTMKQEFQIAY